MFGYVKRYIYTLTGGPLCNFRKFRSTKYDGYIMMMTILMMMMYKMIMISDRFSDQIEIA